MTILRKFLIGAFVLLVSCGTKYENPHIEIQTQYGDIEVELYPKQAPQTVAAFLRYVDWGYYKNASFYRVLNDNNQPSNAPKSALVQGGIWKVNHALVASLSGIVHENTKQTGLHHISGTLSLARQAPGTASTEFFICTQDQPGFDFGGENNPDKQGYAAFGKVVKGMSIVYKIYRSPDNDQQLDPPILITKIVRL